MGILYIAVLWLHSSSALSRTAELGNGLSYILGFIGRLVMKWAAMYLVGFVVLVGGLLAALWKLGILQSIGTTWTLIGVAILIGIGIMFSVSHSGSKENIEIQRK